MPISSLPVWHSHRSALRPFSRWHFIKRTVPFMKLFEGPVRTFQLVSSALCEVRHRTGRMSFVCRMLYPACAGISMAPCPVSTLRPLRAGKLHRTERTNPPKTAFHPLRDLAQSGRSEIIPHAADENRAPKGRILRLDGVERAGRGKPWATSASSRRLHQGANSMEPLGVRLCNCYSNAACSL